MDFANKTILLTGASSGIGKEIAKKLALLDCTLILTARRADSIKEFLDQMSNKRAEIHVFKCDVSDKEQVAQTMKDISAAGNIIDTAILNAGVGHLVTVEEFNSQAAEESFGVNTMGIIYWVEQLLPGFIERRNGIIAGVSSLADNRGFAGSEFYCASKAAATIFLEGLRLQLKKYGVKVLTIKPGFVKTPMTDKNGHPMPFLMSAEKAAGIILEGIEKEKRIIQFPFITAALTRLVGMLPAGLYDSLSGSLGAKEK